MDTVWLAEAYSWWRKHQMEARGSTVVSALMARETERLTIGWGIISPFMRHPVQVAMDARVVQEAAGPGRFILGVGTSKIFLNNAQEADDEGSSGCAEGISAARSELGARGDGHILDVLAARADAVLAVDRRAGVGRDRAELHRRDARRRSTS